jgi:hypothetical protein
VSEKIPCASVLPPFAYFLFHNQYLPKMAGNDSSHDEELAEALRLSLIVNNNTTSSTERQSNSTTGVGGTQSRSTASPEEYAQGDHLQKIKAEAKAEGKCVSYNLGRMGSQAHEAGTARCNNDREKLRAGGIRLANTCPKCSKGTSQLVKSLEAADK